MRFRNGARAAAPHSRARPRDPQIPPPPSPPRSPHTHLFHPEANRRPSVSAASVWRQPPATRATEGSASTFLGTCWSLQGAVGRRGEERGEGSRGRGSGGVGERPRRQQFAMPSEESASHTGVTATRRSSAHLRSPCMSWPQAPQPQVYITPASSTAMLQGGGGEKKRRRVSTAGGRQGSLAAAALTAAACPAAAAAASTPQRTCAASRRRPAPPSRRPAPWSAWAGGGPGTRRRLRTRAESAAL